jgi:hypothetical protein
MVINVSNELVAYIFRIEGDSTFLQNVGNDLPEILMSHHHNHRRKNLKSQILPKI